jgi:polyisoprenyl-teichoic acid--peptidoglycan teichoic acid transferase
VIRRQLVSLVAALAAGVAGLGVATLQAMPAASAPVMQIGEAHAEFDPVLDGSQPIFILVLGSDARPGTAMERGLCDSIHILGINPRMHRASLVGIPRDSYVPVSGGGTNKINVACAQGGPETMVATVEDLTGVTFDYYVITGFGGFSQIFDGLGGLRIDVPYDFEGHAGTVFAEGPQVLNGAQALEYSRTRKTLSHGDFDRSMNQGRVMSAAFRQFRAEFAKDPATLFTWLGLGLRNVATNVPLDDLLTLAFTASQIPPKRVTNAVAVGGVGSAGGMSIVNLTSPQPLFEDIAKDGVILPGDIPSDATPAG